MSTLILIDSNGLIARKLQFISLPDYYAVPEGLTISWRIEVNVWSRRTLPVESYFYNHSAMGQISCRDDGDSLGAEMTCNTMTITVRGASARDVMILRNHIIMNLVNFDAGWKVSNDLNENPKTGFWRSLFGAK